MCSAYFDVLTEKENCNVKVYISERVDDEFGVVFTEEG